MFVVGLRKLLSEPSADDAHSTTSDNLLNNYTHPELVLLLLTSSILLPVHTAAATVIKMASVGWTCIHYCLLFSYLRSISDVTAHAQFLHPGTAAVATVLEDSPETPADGVARLLRHRRHSDLYYRSEPQVSGEPEVEWSRAVAGESLLRLETAVKAARHNCVTTAQLTTSSLELRLHSRILERFSAEVSSAVHAANVLSLLVRQQTRSSMDAAFFFSFVRAMLESSDDWLHSTTFVIDRRSTAELGTSLLAPHASRSSISGVSRVNLTDLAASSSAPVRSLGWYTALLQRNASVIAMGRSCPLDQNETVGVVSELRDALWMSPYVKCPTLWLVGVIVPVFGCDQRHNVVIRGAVKVDIDLDKVEINQCSDSTDAFAGTHHCHQSTLCATNSRVGLKRGDYRCQCTTGFYFPITSQPTAGQYFDGLDVETQYSLMAAGLSYQNDKYVCLPCSRGCSTCDDSTPCDDVITTRVILLAVQIFSMAASLAVAVAIARLRKTKVMKASFWLLLEVIIVGILLVQCTVVVEYFEPTDCLCLLVPWFREVGFTIVYGALMLKAYRVLAEFQSRKAQRILLRDKDLLKYLLTLVIIIVAYMVTWTVVTLEHVTTDSDRHLVELRHLTEHSNLSLVYCSLGWWHYVIEVGECLFLSIGIYLCYCIRSAPTFYLETKFITAAILNELFISAIYYIIRHFVWSFIHPTYLYLLSFLRCQLTITVTLLLVICTKVWYTHRPPSDRRRRQYSTSEPTVPGCEPDNMKLGVDASGLPGDVTEINLADMNPEDIRAELRRLYMQLQVYKTKSMRRDNPHISKRRGGRKPTHRRFSLQAFNYKHRLHQGCSEHSSHDLEPVSRTPEESTNSADVVPTVVEEPASVDSPRSTSFSAARR